MIVKYNRVSTLQQTGDRFSLDKDKYDLVLMDKVSGTVPFKEREKAKELVQLIEAGKVTEVVIEEFSRIGRNTGDVIRTLEWLDEKEINVRVRNIGLESRPLNRRNPIWKMISSVMSSLNEMEKENLLERTKAGRAAWVQKGNKLGRPCKTNESTRTFLSKPKSVEIAKLLQKGRKYSEICAIVDCSPKTVSKVKTMLATVS